MRVKNYTVNSKAWEQVSGTLRLDHREVGLAERMHWTPQDVWRKRPSRTEPWKDEPALYIRRSFDRRHRHIRNTGKPPYDETVWKKTKRLCRLEREEVRMAAEMGMTPGEVMALKGNPALAVRRLYDRQIWTDINAYP